MDNDNKLSTLQVAFINAFIDSVNPTESAIKAGYSANDAKRRARELLKNPKIVEAINAKIEQSARSFAVCKCYFVKKLLEIIDSTTRQEDVLDRSGNPTGKLKLNDAGAALRALDALARCFDDRRGAHSTATATQAQGFPTVLCIENLDESKI